MIFLLERYHKSIHFWKSGAKPSKVEIQTKIKMFQNELKINYLTLYNENKVK